MQLWSQLNIFLNRSIFSKTIRSVYQTSKGRECELSLGPIQISIILLLSGCASFPSAQKPLPSAGPVVAKIVLLAPEMRRFEELGPFAVSEQLEREVTMNLEKIIVVDHYAAQTQDKLPIVIICHGNFSGKNAHRNQARRLASWGFHVVTLELPNREQWVQNGEVVRRFSEMVHNVPHLLGANVDTTRIVLVGHSFGGSASILAMGHGAPVIGAILLDPAVVHDNVISAMKKVDLPIVLLGSDPKLFAARGRKKFSENMNGEVLEISVPKSTHDDAQGPSMYSRSVLGVDPYTSNDRQKVFGALLTVGVIGMASSGTLDFARQIFFRESQLGSIKDTHYRNSRTAFLNTLSK